MSCAMRRWILVLVGAGTTAVVLSLGWREFQPSDDERLAEARQALRERDYPRAEALALEVGRRPGSDGWAWMVAAEAALGAARREDTLRYYEQVREGPAELRAAAAHGRGETCFQLGHLERAELELAAALQAD